MAQIEIDKQKQLEFLQNMKTKSEEKVRMHNRPTSKNTFYARRHQRDVDMYESIINTLSNDENASSNA